MKLLMPVDPQFGWGDGKPALVAATNSDVECRFMSCLTCHFCQYTRLKRKNSTTIWKRTASKSTDTLLSLSSSLLWRVSCCLLLPGFMVALYFQYQDVISMINAPSLDHFNLRTLFILIVNTILSWSWDHASFWSVLPDVYKIFDIFNHNHYDSLTVNRNSHRILLNLDNTLTFKTIHPLNTFS